MHIDATTAMEDQMIAAKLCREAPKKGILTGPEIVLDQPQSHTHRQDNHRNLI